MGTQQETGKQLGKLGRRRFLRATGAAVALIVAAPEVVFAEQEPRFKWHYTKTGVPEVSGDKLTPFGMVTEPGNAVVLVGGPFHFTGSNSVDVNFEGQSKGRDYITVAIAYNSLGGPVSVPVDVWPQGNWVGVTKARPDETMELLRFSHDMVRDPKSGNGKNRNGVKENVDYVLIDTANGSVTRTGSIAGDLIDYVNYPVLKPTPVSAAPAPKPVPAVPTGEPRVYSLQPGQRALVKGNSIITGDVQLEGNVWHDNNPRTGLITIVEKDSQVDAPYGAGVIENPVSGVDTTAQTVANDARANGCGTGNGCTDGVTVTRYPSGKPQR